MLKALRTRFLRPTPLSHLSASINDPLATSDSSSSAPPKRVLTAAAVVTGAMSKTASILLSDKPHTADKQVVTTIIKVDVGLPEKDKDYTELDDPVTLDENYSLPTPATTSQTSTLVVGSSASLPLPATLPSSPVSPPTPTIAESTLKGKILDVAQRATEYRFSDDDIMVDILDTLNGVVRRKMSNIECYQSFNFHSIPLLNGKEGEKAQHNVSVTFKPGEHVELGFGDYPFTRVDCGTTSVQEVIAALSAVEESPVVSGGTVAETTSSASKGDPGKF